MSYLQQINLKLKFHITLSEKSLGQLLWFENVKQRLARFFPDYQDEQM